MNHCTNIVFSKFSSRKASLANHVLTAAKFLRLIVGGERTVAIVEVIREAWKLVTF